MIKICISNCLSVFKFRLCNAAQRQKKANLALGLLLYAFMPFALFCFHKISAHFFRASSSFGLCPHSTQNPPLEFSSRPILSLALLRLCSLRTSLTGLCPSENPQKKALIFIRAIRLIGREG